MIRFLGATLELFATILWLPVHLRNYLAASAAANVSRAEASQAQMLAANAQVMAVLWQMGSDTKPLARLIAGQLHEAYGVAPSSIAPGTLVPIKREAPDA